MSRLIADVAKSVVEDILENSQGVYEAFRDLSEIKFEGVKVVVAEIVGDGKNLSKNMSVVSVVISSKNPSDSWHLSVHAFLSNRRESYV